MMATAGETPAAPASGAARAGRDSRFCCAGAARRRDRSEGKIDAPEKRQNTEAWIGAPGRSRTCGPRLRSPDEAHPRTSMASQPLGTTQDEVGSDSRRSQVFASFTEDSADRLRTLLSVRDVAAYLAVSTKTIYALCAQGKLRHIRVLNAIRIAPSDVDAFVFTRRG